MILGEKQQPHP